MCAGDEENGDMAKVTLICGRLCCGKTTYAKQLCADTGAVLLSVDEVMLAIFGQNAGERHDEYAAGARKYLLEKSVCIVRLGVDVVLDWGFWTRADRARTRLFYSERGALCELYFLDTDAGEWRRRIEKRNRAVHAGEENAYLVDRGLMAKLEARFEPPSADETDVIIN